MKALLAVEPDCSVKVVTASETHEPLSSIGWDEVRVHLEVERVVGLLLEHPELGASVDEKLQLVTRSHTC